MSNFRLECPPAGPPPPTGDECDTTKTISWSSPGTYSVPFFVENITDKIVSFLFTPISNSGSNIVINLIYGTNGVREIKKTFNLSTLPVATTKYHTINFGNFTSGNNVITVQAVITGAGSGSFTVNLDCTVNIASLQFCFVPATQKPSDLCTKCPLVVTAYWSAEYSAQRFPPGEIFQDPELTTEHPLGFYKVYQSQSKPVIYYYNGTKLVKQDACIPIIDCSDPSYALTHTKADYDEIQRFIDPDAPTVPPNILLASAASGVFLPILLGWNAIVRNIKKVWKYSKKEVIIWFPDTSAGYSNLEVSISGGSYKDFYITLEDANSIPPNIGILSYSAYNTNSLFKFVTPEVKLYPEPNTNTIKANILINGEQKVATQALLVNVWVGQERRYKQNVTITTTVNPSCLTSYYSYLMGVHPYSSFDSKYNSPKCQTYVYSLIPIESWQSGTLVMNDSLLTSPGYPYYYSYNNKIYQVGTPIDREFGTIVNYRVKSSGFLNFQKWLGVRESPYIIEPIVVGGGPIAHDEFIFGYDRVESCVNVSFLTGKITRIINTSFVGLSQPTTYLYFLGFSASQTQSEANLPFNFYNYQKRAHESIGGFAHAVYRIQGSFATIPGQQQYTVDWSPGAVNEYLTGLGYAGYIVTSIGIAVWAANNFGIGCDMTLGTGGVCTAAIIVVVIYFALLVNFFVPTTRILSEDCLYFYIAFSTGPYLEIGDTIYLTSTDIRDGLWTDGAYNYVQSGGVIVSKTANEYANAWNDNKIQTQFLPDNPTTITAVASKFFLAYVAGRPDVPSSYVSDPKFISNSTNYVGQLVQTNTLNYNVPAGYIGSDVSQQDANDLLDAFLAEYSALTKYNFSSYGPIPGFSSETFNFTHEIKNENFPTVVLGYYDNSDGLGLQVNKTIFYETQGVCSFLNGFYSISGTGVDYRYFYELSGGSIVDIWTMSSSTSTQVISQETSQVENIVFSATGFTSSWYFYSEQEGNLISWDSKPLFFSSDTWNSASFYSNPAVRRGFISTPLTYETLYLYDSNTSLSGYSEGPDGYYSEVPLANNQEPFVYFTGGTETLFLNITQECSDDADLNGLRISCVDDEGNPTPTFVGVRFNLYVYYDANIAGENIYETYTLQIPSENSEFFQTLPLTSIGTIYNAEIGGFLSENPNNKFYFSGGTFTPCNSPTPTPSPETWTPTPEPTQTTTPTLTPTVTPTPSLPLGECWAVSEIYGNDVYVSYIDRDGVTQCITISNFNTTNICIKAGTSNAIQGFDTAGCTGSGLSVNVSNLNRSCTATGDCSVSPTPTPTLTKTPTTTPTNTTTSTPTPTVTSALSAISLSTAQSSGCVACALTTYSTTGYVNPLDNQPISGDTVYTNSTGTTTFNGASQWFKTTWGNPIATYAIKINASGMVIEVQNCATCPTPTPTPTMSLTPTQTPTVTPTSATPTPTPSITPTNAILCDDMFNNTGNPLNGINYTDCGGTPFTNATVNPGDSICVQQGTLGGGDSGFLINLGNC